MSAFFLIGAMTINTVYAFDFLSENDGRRVRVGGTYTQS
jgi:hypothetical protein